MIGDGSRRQFLAAGAAALLSRPLFAAAMPEPQAFAIAEWKRKPELARLAKAFEALTTGGLSDKAPGRYDLDGLNLYATVTEATTKDPAKGHFERHQNYVDVHYLISGKEMIGNVDRSAVKQFKPYDQAGDAELFELPASYKKLHMTPGHCAVFFPGQLHMPGCWDPSESAIRKVVVKVRWQA